MLSLTRAPTVIPCALIQYTIEVNLNGHTAHATCKCVPRAHTQVPTLKSGGGGGGARGYRAVAAAEARAALEEAIERHAAMVQVITWCGYSVLLCTTDNTRGGPRRDRERQRG